MLALIGLAIVVFASTNLDDLVVLAAFYADPQFRPRDVVVGQYLGIGALTGASAAAGALALTVPDGWPALLGIAPLALGLAKLRVLLGPGGAVEADEAPHEHRGSRALEVAAVTIANGGDNLGVYIPLFARAPQSIPLYAAVFTLMTGAWCAAAFALVAHPAIGARVRRYGRRVLPFVLIALGLWILWGVRVLLNR